MSKTLKIPILYGSQTGNSEQAAQNFAAKLPAELSTSTLTVTSEAIQLDDFLEECKANWSQLCVIICSSYGVGQAPLGAWKFRELCDFILEGKGDGEKEFMKGLQYAMLGLGDSKYTTFFLNPTAIDGALSKAGARRVGSLGKADASGKEDKVQAKVIDKWCEDIIPDLKRAVKEIDASLNEGKETEVKDMLEKARLGTGAICKQIYDTWDDKPPVKKGGGGNTDPIIFFALFATIVVPVLLAVIINAVLNK